MKKFYIVLIILGIALFLFLTIFIYSYRSKMEPFSKNNILVNLDIDFKSITATVTDVFDRCVIYSQVIDIWDEEGQLIDSIFINIDEI